MTGGQQTIDRQQFGELVAEMRALRSNQDRHDEAAKLIDHRLIDIQVAVGRIEERHKSAIWINRALMGFVAAAISAGVSAIGGHMVVPPGAH